MPEIVVFFDIGGTLLDGPDVFEVITKKLVGRWPDETTYHLVAKTYLGMIDLFRKEPTEHAFRSIVDVHVAALTSIANRHGYPDISAQARDICVDVYVHQASFFPEARRVLEKLAENGIKMIVASDNDSLGFNKQIPKFGLDKYFSGYCISEIARAYKPMPGFINNLKKYVTDPKNCYFVGDTWVDVESGKRLGINSVLVDRKNIGNRLGADYVIHDLSGLLTILNLP